VDSKVIYFVWSLLYQDEIPEMSHLPHIVFLFQTLFYVPLNLLMLLSQSLETKCGHARNLGTATTNVNTID